jgi:hypothetical protein
LTPDHRLWRLRGPTTSYAVRIMTSSGRSSVTKDPKDFAEGKPS